MFSDAEVILTKNRIIRQTITLLQEVQNTIVPLAPALDGFGIPPKITRGENYEGLPFVILDYPRVAKKEDVLFIRSMFWWGNFYSSTLHVSGIYRSGVRQNSTEQFPALASQNFHAGIHTDPWRHHFEPDNYQPLHAFSQKAFNVWAAEMPHLKIARYWPLEEWDDAGKNLIESWRLLAALIA